MGRIKDEVVARALEAGSGLVGKHERAERWWRANQGLVGENDLLLRWRMQPVIYDSFAWVTIPGAPGASPTDQKTWHNDIVALGESYVRQALANGRRLAVAYRIGSVSMVGIDERGTPGEQGSRFETGFLRRIDDAEAFGEPAYGVVMRTGPGDNSTAIGTVNHEGGDFAAQRTAYLGAATNKLANVLFRV